MSPLVKQKVKDLLMPCNATGNYYKNYIYRWTYKSADNNKILYDVPGTSIQSTKVSEYRIPETANTEMRIIDIY